MRACRVRQRTRLGLTIAVTTLVALLISATGARAQAPTARDWPSERMPMPLAAREFAFPPYELRSLPNGLQVLVVQHHEQPAVTMRLLVRAGAVRDPQGKPGVAGLVGSLLDQGTTTRSAQEIADQVDFIGGSLGAGAAADLTFANIVVMKDSFDVGLDLLHDLVRNPAFAPEEIARQKEQALSALQVNSRDPDYVADAVFERLVYGTHPYGLPGGGTAETIAAITREDLQAFHRQYFVPNNMVLAIVGDVTADEAFAAATRAFGSWPRGEVLPLAVSEPPAPKGRLVVIDKPDAVQTEIRIGSLAIPRRHPDYLTWDLAVKILGGEGGNRLHRVLRSQRGLTYGAEADTLARREAGAYVAQTDTRTETTAEALRLAVDEFARLQRERVGSRELQDTQAYLSGSFPLTIETPNQIATQVLNAVFYELPPEDLARYRERVTAITPDDIQRVAKAYIHTDRLAIVLVGNAKFFVQRLAALGFGGIDVIPIEQLDLLAPGLRRERRQATTAHPSGGLPAPLAMVGAPVAFSPVQANPLAGRDEPARALLMRVIDAKGGLTALRGVRTLVAEADTTFRLPQGAVTSHTRTLILYPDRFRIEATVGGATVVQAYDAGTAWVQDPTGVREAPAATRDDFAGGVRRDLIPLLIDAADGRLSTRRLDDARDDAATYRVLEVSGMERPAVRLWLDPLNQVARMAYAVTDATGARVEADERLGDYRTVDGIRVAFTASLYQGTRAILDRVLTQVLINAPVDRRLFARPR